MSWGLPKLPGFTFPDPSKTSFTVAHKFEYRNGYRCLKPEIKGIGGEPLDLESSAYLELTDPSTYDASLTYGRVKDQGVPPFLPHYVHYANKCLTFKAFLRQSVPESPLEYFRIRFVNIMYFLEDDTITVMEPQTRNSGIWQGKMVRKAKILKNNKGEFYHWKDLNVGMDLTIYGKVFHTYACDDFSREFLLSQGIEVADDEEPQKDPYAEKLKWAAVEHHRVTPVVDDKLKRFLNYDGKVLSFDAVWDDRESEHGDLKKYKLSFFLEDNSIAVKELHDPRGGSEKFPLLLKRTRVPKNWKDQPVNYPAIVLEPEDSDYQSGYYNAKDLAVGNTIFIFGRKFLLYDCEPTTRHYYKMAYGFNQPPKIEVAKQETTEYVRPLPPHIGIGDPEDALGSCYGVEPKPPKKDVLKYVLNANKYLRYTCIKDPDLNPEEVERRFVLLYSLADNTIKINEIPRRNSGIREGRFLSSMRVELPDSDPNFPSYYTPDKFYVGAVIYIFKHRFIITGCDLFVYRYVEANPGKFPPGVLDNIRNYHLREGNLQDDLKEAIAEEAATERRRQMEKMGRMTSPKRDELQDCLDRLRMGDEPVISTSREDEDARGDLDYDEYLRFIKDRSQTCDPSPLTMALICPHGKGADCQCYKPQQSIVAFTAPAAPGQEPRSPVISALESERLTRYQEPIIARGPKECQVPIVTHDRNGEENGRNSDNAGVLRSDGDFGINCNQVPEFMYLPADAYKKAAEYKRKLEDQGITGSRFQNMGQIQGSSAAQQQAGAKTVTFAEPPVSTHTSDDAPKDTRICCFDAPPCPPIVPDDINYC